jgi:hypothetical protein
VSPGHLGEHHNHDLYIENQALDVPEIVAELESALTRGVEAVVLVPAQPEQWVRAARKKPERLAFFDQLAALGQHERFALVGIAQPTVPLLPLPSISKLRYKRTCLDELKS